MVKKMTMYKPLESRVSVDITGGHAKGPVQLRLTVTQRSDTSKQAFAMLSASEARQLVDTLARNISIAEVMQL